MGLRLEVVRAAWMTSQFQAAVSGNGSGSNGLSSVEFAVPVKL